MKKIGIKIKKTITTILKGIRFFWKEYRFLVPPMMLKVYFKVFLERIRKPDLKHLFYDIGNQKEYLEWIEEKESFTEETTLKENPLISIVMPVYNVPEVYLRESIDSVLNQTYENWELCIADDCSTEAHVKEVLDFYQHKDTRIKVVYRESNGHISAATNSALEITTGSYIGLLDNDDILSKHALYEMVHIINENNKLDMIYSDEDKLDSKGLRCNPNFKPDFSPETLLGANYICHFTVIRASIMKQLKGFNIGYEGVQDHDLFIRATELTSNIYHIPKILYHWRMIDGSTAQTTENKPYIEKNGIKMLNDTLERRGIKGHVEKNKKSFSYKFQFENKGNEKVSIIIPTKNQFKVLQKCLDSIYKKTTYHNFEIILIDNGSTEKNTLELLKTYEAEKPNFKVLLLDCPFNYSYLNNKAVEHATGEYLVLLNNDTEIISPDWIEQLLGYARQPHIGAVGALLLYPDNTIQHGGVILGLGGVATHAYHNVMAAHKDIYLSLNIATNVGAVTAACLMISKAKYREVEGLNEELMVAYNDVDLNLKLLEKGYYNVFNPNAVLYHHESKSRGLDTSSEKYKRFLEENQYMYDHWVYQLTHDKFYNENYSLYRAFALDKKNHKMTPLEKAVTTAVL